MAVGEIKDKENKSKFIDDECIEMLNNRINEEEHASRLYKSMAIWLSYNSYDGFAKYWNTWSQEELVHASWACSYLLDIDVKPNVMTIAPVQNKFDSLIDVIEQTLQAEIDITTQCNLLAKMANDKNDFMLLNLAQQYLAEQQEEIDKITNILSKVKTYGDSKQVLLELDEEFGEK